MDPRQHQALRMNTESGEIKDGTEGEGGRKRERGGWGEGRRKDAKVYLIGLWLSRRLN